MKRYFRAFAATLSLLASSILAPIFGKCLEQQTGVTPNIFYFVSFVLILGVFAFCIACWASAISGRDIKDL